MSKPMTPQIEYTPTIEVHIPDYDTSFVYRLVFGEICEFSDNNLLDLSHRAELTELVSVVNARLLELNRLRRQMAIFPELVKALRLMSEHYDDLSKSNPGFMGKLCLQDYSLWNEALIAMRSALTRANEIKL